MLTSAQNPAHVLKNKHHNDDSDDESDNIPTKLKTTKRTDSSQSDQTGDLPRMKDYFQVGDYVLCTIIQLNPTLKSRRVVLSLKPQSFNKHYTKSMLVPGMPLTGSIKSIQDHGSIVSFENPNFLGFLPNPPQTSSSNSNSSSTSTSPLKVGQLVRVIVDKINSNNVINLSCNNFKWNGTITKDNFVPSIECVYPGMLVQASLRSVVQNGLWLRFLDFYGGGVPTLHAGVINPSDLESAWNGYFSNDNNQQSETSEQKEGEKKKKKKKSKPKMVKARIIYVDHELKKIGLSLLPHIVGFTPLKYSDDFRIGANLSTTSLFLSEHVGLYSSLYSSSASKRASDQESMEEDTTSEQSSTNKKLIGFTLLNRISDDEEELTEKKLKTKYKPGSKHSCRVTGHSLIDGIINVAMAHSILSQQFLGIEDIVPGIIIKSAIVLNLTEDSRAALLQLSDVSKLKAICPASHFNELDPRGAQAIQTLASDSKFQPGAKIKVRVLKVEHQDKKVVCTAKRGLVDSKLPILSSFEMVKPGMIVHGWVSNIKSFGVFISFYNDLTGLLPRIDILKFYKQWNDENHLENKDKDLFNYIKPGQVRQVRVAYVNTVAKNITLSLSLTPGSSEVEKNLNSQSKKEKNSQKTSNQIEQEENKTNSEMTEKRLKSKEEKKIEEELREALDWQDLKQGDSYTARIIKQESWGYWCRLNSKIRGKLLILDLSPHALIDLKTWQSNHSLGSILPVFVKSVNHSRRQLDFSLNKTTTITNTKNEKGENKNEEELKEGEVVMGTINIHSKYKGKALRLNVQLQSHIYGKVFLTDVSDNYTSDPFKSFKDGDVVRCFILENTTDSVNHTHKIDLSLRPSRVNPNAEEKKKKKKNKEITSTEELKEGMKVSGYVTKHSRNRAVIVSLSRNITAQIGWNHLSDIYRDILTPKDAQSKFPIGTLVSGSILKILTREKFEYKKKRIAKKKINKNKEDDKEENEDEGEENEEEEEDKEEDEDKNKEENKEEENKKVEYETVIVMTLKKQIQQKLAKNRREEDKQELKIEQSKRRLPNEIKIQNAKVKVGDTYKASVKLIKPKGILFKFCHNEGGIVGYCETSEILGSKQGSTQRKTNSKDSSNKDPEDKMTTEEKMILKDLRSRYSIDDEVEVTIIKIGSAEENTVGQVFLSVKRGQDDSNSMQLDNNDRGTKKSLTQFLNSFKNDENNNKQESLEQDDNKDKEDDNEEGNDDDDEEEEEEDEKEDDAPEGWGDFSFGNTNKKQTPQQETAKQQDKIKYEEDMDMDVDSSTTKSGKPTTTGKSKYAKTVETRRKEEHISAVEKALSTQTLPESADAFEKLLISSPNSSYLWIRYLAFHVSLTQLDQARDVAEKALAKINFREEGERSNVWKAYLNLESQFGTRSTLLTVFERALANCEQKSIYYHLISIFDSKLSNNNNNNNNSSDSNKKENEEIIEKMYERMARKYGSEDVGIWIKWAKYKIRHERDVKSARELMQRGLKRLDKKKHIEMIVKMGVVEFKEIGDVERGRNILEGVVGSMEKRTDVWGVYLDMEKRRGSGGNQDEEGTGGEGGEEEKEASEEDRKDSERRVRNLYRRATDVKGLSSKKIKGLFRAWLKWEKEVRDRTKGFSDQFIDEVKEKIKQYASSSSL